MSFVAEGLILLSQNFICLVLILKAYFTDIKLFLPIITLLRRDCKSCEQQEKDSRIPHSVQLFLRIEERNSIKYHIYDQSVGQEGKPTVAWNVWFDKKLRTLTFRLKVLVLVWKVHSFVFKRWLYTFYRRFLGELFVSVIVVTNTFYLLKFKNYLLPWYFWFSTCINFS